MNLHILITHFNRIIIAPFNLIVNPQLCDQLAQSFIPKSYCIAASLIPGERKERTPLSSFITILPRTLHQIVAKDICDLHGVIYLHSRIDAHAPVLVEVATGFLACGEEDSCVVWIGRC